MAIRTSLQQGITLIELLVVLAIVGMVSSVLLFNFSNFSTNITVRNLASEIGLAVRKAQTYATSSNQVVSINKTYGVSFSLGGTADNVHPSEKKFILFVDMPTTGVENGTYDQTNTTCGAVSIGQECVEVFNINTADRIIELEIDNGVSGIKKITSGTVNVLFHRPSPDADICEVINGVCESQRSSKLKITVQSAKDLKRTITIFVTGQISVQ